MQTRITNLEKAHAIAVEKTAEEFQIALNKANKDREAVHVEYTALRLEMGEQTKAMEILQEELNTCQKEPTGPQIPRVTKHDGYWTKVWKKLLQVIAK